ncbi:MAG: zinc ABC transporter substrate-binding protein [Chthoniobacterales bacterium]|nr:zinc ABC transporter substrate-binding protein [Chthoniobacterales bacterium]
MMGCSRDDDATAATSQPGDAPHRITATVGMVTDIVQQVAGKRAVVTGIVGEGIDPHLYKPTRNDIAALLNADAVFYSGLYLEGKMADTLEQVKAKGRSVYAVTELIDEAFLLTPPEFEGHHDPHVWMDVRGWMSAVEATARSLAEFDPAHADEYNTNAQAYLADLKKLDDYARTSIASIPEKQRVLITAHDAFNYFGRAYKIQVRGIQGISTESEAGLQDINGLVNFIVDNDIGAIFVETSVAEKNVRALIDGARSRGRAVSIGGTLYSDAMGPAGSYEGTYIGMIDHNVTVITRALGGTAPERGLNGKLATK